MLPSVELDLAASLGHLPLTILQKIQDAIFDIEGILVMESCSKTTVWAVGSRVYTCALGGRSGVIGASCLRRFRFHCCACFLQQLNSFFHSLHSFSQFFELASLACAVRPELVHEFDDEGCGGYTDSCSLRSTVGRNTIFEFRYGCGQYRKDRAEVSARHNLSIASRNGINLYSFLQ